MEDTNRSAAQLEKNIVLLLNKLKDNHYTLSNLTEQLEKNVQQNKSLLEENTLLKEQNESLTLANSLLGSDQSNVTTKDKINALIQQVDDCINQLYQMT